MKRTFLIGLVVTLLWSCTNAGTENSGNAHSVASDHMDKYNNERSEPLTLNNGEKWIVNDEMKPFVAKGEELVNSYLEQSESDYKTLAAQVKAQNTQLISSCTMSGKSHDELHKWLYPHLKIVETLESESVTSKANALVTDLQASYKEYHQFFH